MTFANILVPEHIGRRASGGSMIPMGYAVAKSDHIANSSRIVANMEREIVKLEREIAKFADTQDRKCQDLIKRLAKCREIKQNCEDSVRRTTMQMGLRKNVLGR